MLKHHVRFAIVAAVLLVHQTKALDTSFIHRFFYKTVNGSNTMPNNGGAPEVQVKLMEFCVLDNPNQNV